MTTADPSRSPAGTESLWAYTHLPQRPHWREEEISAHAQRMEEVLEAHAPGFRALIRGRYVAGPADLERANPSLVGGALGGGTLAPYQQLFFRPVPGPGPGRHAGGPALPGQRLRASRRRGARGTGVQRGAGRARPGSHGQRAPLPGGDQPGAAEHLPVRRLAPHARCSARSASRRSTSRLRRCRMRSLRRLRIVRNGPAENSSRSVTRVAPPSSGVS